jgi:hypothetical protein
VPVEQSLLAVTRCALSSVSRLALAYLDLPTVSAVPAPVRFERSSALRACVASRPRAAGHASLPNVPDAATGEVAGAGSAGGCLPRLIADKYRLVPFGMSRVELQIPH